MVLMVCCALGSVKGWIGPVLLGLELARRTQRQILPGRFGRPRGPDRLADPTPLDRSTPSGRSASAFAGKLNPQTYPTDGAQELRRHEIRRTASGDQTAA